MKIAFNGFKVGQMTEFKHRITDEDVKKFIDITGDDNPIHTDKNFAQRTSFKDVIAHGMLGASFISTMIGKYLPGEGALWVSQSLNFLRPVRIGDELTIKAKITKKHAKQRLLTLDIEIINQYKQSVLRGEAVVKLLELSMKSPEHVKTKIKNKVVLITGASRGIGAATAAYLAGQKYCVAINYQTDKNGAEEVCRQILRHKGRAMIVKADVRDRLAVNNMVDEVIEEFGTITALVNNATSTIVSQDFAVLEWQDVQLHIDTQVMGAFNCVQAVMGEFIKNRYGAVVNVGSIVSDYPTNKWLGYTVAKNALSALTKSLAVEFGPKGIRFNTVSPGMTDTGLIADIPEKARLIAAMQTPLRRLAVPCDIAKAITFLLSDEALYITGETLRVCGGQVMV